jgi:hypothetical protein
MALVKNLFNISLHYIMAYQLRFWLMGFLREKIKIERGVKQGDALSCSFFILCMDQLIRNLNKNKKIEPITFKSKLTHMVVKHKASGYADDIGIVCRNKLGSVQEVFFE